MNGSREIIEIIKKDRRHGSIYLTKITGKALLKALDEGVLRDAYEELISAQPSMASVLKLAFNVMKMHEKGAAALEIENYINEFTESISIAVEDTAVKCAALIKDKDVFTLSDSFQVEAALIRLEKVANRRITVAESAPGYEGIYLAKRLSSSENHVSTCSDAAFSGMIKKDSVLLLGADALFNDCFVNKRGSLEAAEAAKKIGAIVIVAATPHKLLDSPKLERLFRIENRELFEKVPLKLVDHLIL